MCVPASRWEYAGMSANKKTTATDAANWGGALAAVICASFGFDQGGWPGAAIAAVIAFGGVHLAFAAVAIVLRLAAGVIVLLLTLVALKSRLEWLAGVLQ